MKGAISMSKSRTGDCIFRTNKTVKKELDRLVKIEVRNSHYNVSRIDTGKKMVVNRWTKLLEHQTMVSSQALFEEILDINDMGGAEHDFGSEKEDLKLKSLIDVRLSKLQSLIDTGGLSPRGGLHRQGHGPNRNEPHNNAEETSEKQETGPEFVTEKKEIRTKYSGHEAETAYTEPTRHTVGLAKSKSLSSQPGVAQRPGQRFPALRREQTIGAGSQEEERIPPMPALVRDLTDWGNWRLNDKSWIRGYLDKEKTRHEDLIIRNALKNIEHEMSGANMIKRHQIRQKLQNDKNVRETELRKKDKERMKRESFTPQTIPVQNLSIPNSSTISEPQGTNNQKKTVGFAMPESELLENPEAKKTWSPKAKAVYTNKQLCNKKQGFKGGLPVIREKSRPLKGILVLDHE
ncbi:uncharacterized protein LOC128232573 isoform X2 [Mya arenaria]|nr:uncharacterized protein LOC128232573 isoform X2 [Mya arenaria]